MDIGLLVSRILVTKIRFIFSDTNYVITPLESEDILLVEQYYLDMIKDLEYSGVYTNDELKLLLCNENLWSKENEEELSHLSKAIENSQHELFEQYTVFRKLDYVRKKLLKLRQRRSYLLSLIEPYVYYTCEGIAEHLKNRYQVFLGLKLNSDYMSASSRLIDAAFSAYAKMQLSDSQIRAITKSREWRNLWYDCKTVSSFPFSATNFTINQRCAISWSRFYDNVYESAECPSEEVIEDDDLLDGWAIYQHRKSLRSRQNSGLDLSKNKNANEMFLIADDPNAIEKINNLNDPEAMAIKRQRQSIINKSGTIPEEKFPDAKLRMLEQRRNHG